MIDHSILPYLTKAYEIAKDSIDISEQYLEKTLKELEHYMVDLTSKDIMVRISEKDFENKDVKYFYHEFNGLIGFVSDTIQISSVKLRNAFLDLKNNSHFVTIMLFGRTKAGKSTTMEVLTHGSGSTIGKGRQNTTKQVKAYYLPKCKGRKTPISPSLRIVDTPGIEGYSGDNLAEMAKEYIDRCDCLLFLITNDKAGAQELDNFKMINSKGKRVIVLLNVKSRDEDLDILIKVPDLIFNKHEIDGHVRRIRGYLMRNFGIVSPEIIPYHAQAAWLSVSKKTHITADREMLKLRSRFNEVEKSLVSFVQNEAFSARIKTPLELLNDYIMCFIHNLEQITDNFSDIEQQLNKRIIGIAIGIEKARKRVFQRLPLIKARFDNLSLDVPSLVDRTIVEKGNLNQLNKLWKEALGNHEIEDIVAWFTKLSTADFCKEVAEQIQIIKADYELSGEVDIQSEISDYYQSVQKQKGNKVVRSGMKIAGSTGMSVLTGWAIVNWWNPTGWAAAGAALISAAVGYGGYKGTEAVLNSWENSNKHELMNKKTAIIEKMRKGLWKDYENIRDVCSRWLDETVECYLSTSANVLEPLLISTKHILSNTGQTIEELVSIIDKMNMELVSRMIRLIFPNNNQSLFSIQKVTREPGYQCNILIKRLSGFDALNYDLVNQLQEKLGECVRIVDQSSSKRNQIAQALGLHKMDCKNFERSCTIRRSQARLLIRHEDIKLVEGKEGINKKLAEKLLCLNIEIKEVKDVS